MTAILKQNQPINTVNNYTHSF